MSDAVSKFVEELTLHFSKRFDSEQSEDQWLASMRRNLRGYDAEVLAEAGQRIIDRRKDRYFPLPAECKQVCEEVAKFKRLASPELQKAERPESYDWRYKLAAQLIHCELGRQAAREGWILALRDFVRENGKLPTEPWQIANCKKAAKGFDEAYEVCLRGEAGDLSKKLAEWGSSLAAKREDLRGKVLGEGG